MLTHCVNNSNSLLIPLPSSGHFMANNNIVRMLSVSVQGKRHNENIAPNRTSGADAKMPRENSERVVCPIHYLHVCELAVLIHLTTSIQERRFPLVARRVQSL